jgi:aldose 1-epimerase
MRRIDALKAGMDADKSLWPTDHWYDHNFMLRGRSGEMKHACTMFDEPSGRVMEIWTTEPAMQMYGAQNMDGSMPAKKAGAKYPQFAGMALETQHCPDSPNHPEFPSTVLRPGGKFLSRTEYRFFAK